MASGTELWEAWKEGFANKDSSKLAELLTDDFRFVSVTRDIGKQETLDWTSTGDIAIDNLEVIYENDEVAVVHHSANSIMGANGLVMCLYTKRDGKFSHCRIV